jgi:hypothetical protein
MHLSITMIELHIHTVWRDFDGDFGRDAPNPH